MIDEYVADKIRNAFAARSQPADPFAGTDDIEEEDLRSLFEGRRWQDVDLRELSTHFYSPWWFNDEGRLYYLPAFLLTAIEKSHSTDSGWGMLGEWGMNRLGAVRPGSAFCTLFNAQEQDAISEWVLYINCLWPPLEHLEPGEG
jgi:hypothetical protein